MQPRHFVPTEKYEETIIHTHKCINFHKISLHSVGFPIHLHVFVEAKFSILVVVASPRYCRLSTVDSNYLFRIWFFFYVSQANILVIDIKCYQLLNECIKSNRNHIRNHSQDLHIIHSTVIPFPDSLCYKINRQNSISRYICRCADGANAKMIIIITILVRFSSNRNLWVWGQKDANKNKGGFSVTY